MATSFGLVKQDGIAISGSNDWTAARATSGHVELTFDRDVSSAVVVATQQTPYCDVLTQDAIQIGKSQNNRVVCVYNARSRFSFILMDADPRPEGKDVFD